ncbi:IS110 family transposase [Collinsella intestinalis]|uniref:IS110 family transposase n=1 Tax=Collinsella intestinalis TaxID=147207 RepID=UPI00195C3B5C|nr:IS110 family transposase [Collinsella intestinalis]MBM6683983.1 IS110 family transposase [Collinsella intestinalis]
MGRRRKKAPAAVVGFDVGKSFHWAFGVGAGGEAVLSERVDNRPAAIDRVLAEAGAGALVVVDQRRNIGALVLARARAAGMRVAYLPGRAEKQAREMFPATAKTDELDAEVIARTALGMPWTLREVPEEDERRASLRMLSSQRAFCVKERTESLNRLRAVLLEADPALEAALDPSRRWQLEVLAALGSAHGCAAAGEASYRRLAGARGGREDAFWEVLSASAASRPEVRAEGTLASMLAGQVLARDAEVAALDAAIGELLEGDATYEALLTVPGVGPRTAAALVASVDVTMFRSHDELASYCGIAPADSQSGTSARSTRPKRGGSKPLKNLLVFSCNSLIGTKNEFGRYYEKCRGRGMRHNKALKAVARKRLKVIYAIMRDRAPYRTA